MAAFDTLRAVQNLRGIGVPEDQAETMVEVILAAQSQLVTKEELRAELYRVAFFQFAATIATLTAIVAALTQL